MSIIWTHRLDNAPKRVNHAAAAIGHFIYSFGGYSSGDDYQSRRGIDIHCLNTLTLQWSLIKYDESNLDDIPFQRYGHTVVAHGHDIFLWGGRNDEGACNELYKFDTICNEWNRMKTTGFRPKSRDGHSATIVGNDMYIFGGFEDETERFSNDVHKLNLNTFVWTLVQTRGSPPMWRDFHTKNVIDNCLYVFGGRSDSNGPYHTRSEVYDNAIYKLDLATDTWTKMDVTNNPIGRRSHSAFVYNGNLYIFGGYNGLLVEHYNDLWSYNPVTNHWSEVFTHGKDTGNGTGIGIGPTPRRRQSCCLIGSKLYLFGGTSPSGIDRLAGSNNNNPAIAPESRLKDQNDLHILDFNSSLSTLSKIAIIKHQLDTTYLPSSIQLDVEIIRGNPFLRDRCNTGTG